MTRLTRGTYVLRAEHIVLNEARCVGGEIPSVGQTWFWHGTPVEIDMGVAPLGAASLRARASRSMGKKFLRAAGFVKRSDPVTHDDQLADGFVITDGAEQFTLVPLTDGKVFWCPNGIPKPGQLYRVLEVSEKVARPARDDSGDLICFTTGTKIATPEGNRLVEDLCAGDKVLTKDNGPQEIAWIGHRHITGALLQAMPRLRPVRLKTHALGHDIPDDDLLVSPHHRVLLTGARAQALFGQPEVLVKATDLINDHSVHVDHKVQDVTYIHLLLGEHQILWANGVQTESYHPAQTKLNMVEETQRTRLLDMFPQIRHDPFAYGPFARRNLNLSEAAILKHDRLS